MNYTPSWIMAQLSGGRQAKGVRLLWSQNDSVHLTTWQRYLTDSMPPARPVDAYALSYYKGLPKTPSFAHSEATALPSPGTLERRIREASEFHIDGVRLHGETVPEPTNRAGQVVRRYA